MSSNSISLDYLKPLIAGGVAIALDKFYLNEGNMNKSIMFGAATAAGVFGGTLLGPMAPDIQLPILGNGKGLEQRILEIGAGSGIAYGVNTYVLKNNSFRDEMIQKLGVIVVADLVSELAADFLGARPLSVFS